MRFLISLSCYVAVFAVLLRCVSLSSVAAVFRRFLPCCPLVPPFPSSSERPCRLPRPAGIVPLRFKFAAWLRDSSRLLQPSPTVHAIMPLRSRAHAHSAIIHAHVTGDSTVTRCPSFRGEQDAEADCGTRFLLAYGDQNRTIPVEDQDTARRVISGTRGARLCTYPGMAHAICDREIDDIRDFLR